MPNELVDGTKYAGRLQNKNHNLEEVQHSGGSDSKSLSLSFPELNTFFGKTEKSKHSYKSS